MPVVEISVPKPADNRAVAVRVGQMLRLEASDPNQYWFYRVNGAGWTLIDGPSPVQHWTAPGTVTERLTFDRVEVALGSTNDPANVDANTARNFDVVEGPVAEAWVTPIARNEALEGAPLVADVSEHDLPPLGSPLFMPGVNRDGFSSVVPPRAITGGPVSSFVSLGPGVLVDTSGRLSHRSSAFAVRGLGPFPVFASQYHAGMYFEYDFGKSRTIGGTRVLYQSGTNVAIVRGDGRRNTYRFDGSSYVPASGIGTTLALVGGKFQETSPTGRVYHFNAVSSGRATLEKVVDRYGLPVYYEYNGTSQRLEKIQGLSGTSGLVPYLSYDTNGLLWRLVLEDGGNSANNRSIYFQYDADQNVTRVIEPESVTTYFEYNAPERLSAVSDSTGARWYFAYDADGRVLFADDALANRSYFAFDTGASVATLRDRCSRAIYFELDARGGPRSVFNASTPADYFTWGPDGELTSSTNRLGRQWTYEYDSRGNRIAVTDPLSARSYFAYDAQDLLRFVRDAVGQFNYLDFDGARNRTKTIDALGFTTYFGYQTSGPMPTAGLLHYRKDRRGHLTYFRFDAQGNNDAVVDPLGNKTYFIFNSAGERELLLDARSNATYWVHDTRGRVTSQTDAYLNSRRWAFDARGMLVKESDERGFTTYHLHDANRNVTRTVRHLGGAEFIAAYFDYDPEERLRATKDARLNETYWTFDELGRRQLERDALGFARYWHYDDAHEVVKTRDQRLNTSYLEYDLVGRVQFTKNANFDVTYFGFDQKGRPVRVTDARGLSADTFYTARDQVHFTRNAIGAFQYFEYDADGNRTAAVDPLASRAEFQFDERALLRATKDAFGNYSYLEYDEVGNIIRTLAPPQNGSAIRAATYFTFDKLNRRQRAIDAHQSSTYLGFDAVGNRTLSVDARGNATYHTFDPVNRLRETIDPGRARTYFAQDAVGNVVRVDVEQGFGRQPWNVSPFGGERVSTYMTFDALNRSASTRTATSLRSTVAALTTYVYDAAGNRTTVHVENPEGEANALRNSYFVFDRVNRVVRAIDPPATSTTAAGFTYFEFDAVGNRVRVVDQEGRPTYLAYDEGNRVRAQWNAFLETSYLEYDLRNAVTKRIDPLGRTAYLSYDALGRKQTESNALGNTSYFGYDARSELVLVVNPRGYPTYTTFDLIGRATHRKDARGGVRYWGYDEVGNKVLELDELGNPNYWHYDRSNRVVVTRDGLQNPTYFAYDAVGLLRRKIDAEGRTTYFGYHGYDAARRTSRVTFSSDPSLYYVYDSVGNLIQTTDETGTFSQSYDALDRLTAKSTLAGNQYITYDKSGQRDRFIAPDGVTSYYTYDAALRLSRVVAREVNFLGGISPLLTYFFYDQSGARTKKIAPRSSFVSYYSYDTAGRVYTIENLNGNGALQSYFQYDRDENGNVVKIRREQYSSAGDDIYYKFDALDRLVSERREIGGNLFYGWLYNYDAASNRYFKHDLTAASDPTTYYFYDGNNKISKEVNQ